MGNTVNMLIAYIFALSLILLLAVYYVGVQTDTKSFSAAINSLLQTATGRTSNGTFAGYPA